MNGGALTSPKGTLTPTLTFGFKPSPLSESEIGLLEVPVCPCSEALKPMSAENTRARVYILLCFGLKWCFIVIIIIIIFIYIIIKLFICHYLTVNRFFIFRDHFKGGGVKMLLKWG